MLNYKVMLCQRRRDGDQLQSGEKKNVHRKRAIFTAIFTSVLKRILCKANKNVFLIKNSL
jgi:hypothetical protein